MISSAKQSFSLRKVNGFNNFSAKVQLYFDFIPYFPKKIVILQSNFEMNQLC